VRAFTHPGNKQFPDTGAEKFAHRVHAAVPIVEVAHHADAPGIGCQHREGDPRDAVQHHRVGAELLVEVHMRALAEQIEVEVGQHRGKTVGIFEFDHALSEPRAHAVAPRSIAQAPCE